ncbi:hypothetical protein EI94DRAFT_277482 [Lactarius quietus]|nr:hypothetical protein EI94DRAFT_277482 [Lactarius quietus]
MLSEVFCVTSPAHVKHRLEALYWNHWSLFPAVFDGRYLQPAVYDELIGILSHGCMDVMTSKSSTLPYDEDTMQKMIKLVRKAKESDAGVVYHTAGVTRLLSFFAHWRFLYVHGQHHARLVKHHTVYSGSKKPRSLLITLLSLVLFLAPEVHLKEVEKLWTDEIIIERVWKTFMTKLLGEWEELILWSTVMLTANVGFLAIPGVVISNINETIISASMLKIFLSTSQIASSISILASVGSIVIGLLLVRHNRSKQKEDPAGAAAYLYQSTHPIFGLEPMAIIFSLPWALLMWAMVLFFIALQLFSFYYSNTLTRIVVTAASVPLFVLTVWCIGMAWEESDGREERFNNLLPSIRRAFRNARVRCQNLFVVISRRERPHPSSHSLGHANSVHSMSGREAGVV